MSMYDHWQKKETFIQRPLNEKYRRVYLGAIGPKYALPVSSVATAEAWWNDHIQKKFDEARSRDWRLAVTSVLMFGVPVAAVYFGNLQYLGILPLVVIPLYFSIYSEPTNQEQRNFEAAFPDADYMERGRIRKLRAGITYGSRTSFIVLTILCLGGGFVAISEIWEKWAEQSLSDWHHWLVRSLTDWEQILLISSMAGFIGFAGLLGVYGIYLIAIDMKFRRTFKRPPTEDDLRSNIDWFDGVDENGRPLL